MPEQIEEAAGQLGQDLLERLVLHSLPVSPRQSDEGVSEFHQLQRLRSLAYTLLQLDEVVEGLEDDELGELAVHFQSKQDKGILLVDYCVLVYSHCIKG